MWILGKNKSKVKVNMDEFAELKQGHMLDTRIIIAKMYSALPKELKEEVNMSDLQDAAMLHDYGKILIPAKILKKEGELTPEEKHIMELHSEIGYELLKDQGVRPEVLRLIKYHHSTPQGGYPVADNGFEYDVSIQMLRAADEYSALTEKRTYKEAMTKEEALETIKKDVEKGLLSQEVFDALKKSV